MSDIRRNLESPKVRYVNNKTNAEDEISRVLIDGNRRFENGDNQRNNIELVRVKLLESTAMNAKERPLQLRLQETRFDDRTDATDDDCSSFESVAEDSKPSTKTSVIKLKLIVPKGCLENAKIETNCCEIDDEKKVVKETDDCIFEENRLRPLSPISTEHFAKVERLVELHEQLSRKNVFRHSVPIMGRAALLAKSSGERAPRDDSEIIGRMVRDRFVVNAYDSRLRLNRSLTRPTTGQISSLSPSRSRFGKIFRSLDRNSDIRQSSPVKNIIRAPSTPPQILADGSEADNETRGTTSLSSSASTVSIAESCPASASSLAHEPQSSDISFAELQELCDDELDATPVNQQAEETRSVNSTTSDVLVPEEKTDSSYDMEEFLKKALGDDFEANSSVSSSMLTQQSPYQMTSREKPINQRYDEASVCTADASDLVSKITTLRSSIYHSLTKKLRITAAERRPNTAVSHGVDQTDADDDLDSLLPNNEAVVSLVAEAALQMETMRQVSKALGVCRATKEFAGGAEEAEAERFLLIATLRRQALLTEIRRLDYELDAEPSPPSAETANVTLRHIELSVTTPMNDRTDARPNLCHWYVCVATAGRHVLATAAVPARAGTVLFPDELTFRDLHTDFSISVEVFVLAQRRSTRNFSHESKFHLNKDARRSRCPFLIRDKQMRKASPTAETPITNSSFRASGGARVRVCDVGRRVAFQLRKLPLRPNVAATLALDVRVSALSIPLRYAGFLTVGLDIGHGLTPSWNRRWCELRAPLLRVCDGPRRRDDDADDDDASDVLHVVDLRRCINARVEPVCRSVCARPKTLLLETSSTATPAADLRRYLLSADTISEMRAWETHLNKVVAALHTWNSAAPFA